MADLQQHIERFLDEMRRRGDFWPLALGDVKPGAGKRRLYLLAGHALGPHDAISLCSGRPIGAAEDGARQAMRSRILAESDRLRNGNR